MWGRLALVRIGVSLPLEVPSDIATLHGFAHDNAHRANNNFQVSEAGSKARTRLFYKNLEQQGLKVSAVGRKVYCVVKKKLCKAGSDAMMQM